MALSRWRFEKWHEVRRSHIVLASSFPEESINTLRRLSLQYNSIQFNTIQYQKYTPMQQEKYTLPNGAIHLEKYTSTYVIIEYERCTLRNTHEKYTRRNTLGEIHFKVQKYTSMYGTIEYERCTDGSFLCDIFDASTPTPPLSFSHKT